MTFAWRYDGLLDLILAIGPMNTSFTHVLADVLQVSEHSLIGKEQ